MECLIFNCCGIGETRGSLTCADPLFNCIGVSRRSAQETADKGLAQGPYVAARAGIEPTTLRLKVIVSTKAPPHRLIYLHKVISEILSFRMTLCIEAYISNLFLSGSLVGLY